MPEISIIVPVYNVEEYLANCIESILNQTFRDFELILVNDGTKDNSLEICKRYEAIDSRIKIVDKENGGLSSARNAGLDVAKGKYIGFVDSDDYIHPQMYEILYNEIINYEADISICEFEKVYDLNPTKTSFENGKYKVDEFNNLDALNQLTLEKSVEFIVSWNKLYKKELFNNIRFKKGMIHEDEFIIHRLLYKANKIIYINKELYYYLQRKSSIMGSSNNVTKIDYLLALSDRIIFLNKYKILDLQYKFEVKYFEILYKFYPSAVYNKNAKNKSVKIWKLRFNFLKLIKVLEIKRQCSFKERISWFVFISSPNLYYKIVHRNF